MIRKPPKGKSLAEVNPELVKEWHPSKNGQLIPFDFAPKSNKVVWWKCPKGDEHEWKAKIYSRTDGNSCPVCSGHKVVSSNCLATLNPELASQWHPSKNSELTPFDVTPNSGKKFWWKCPKGNDHEWFASVDNRTRGRGCPICSNKIVVESNSLMTLSPNLANEWHPSKNNPLTPRDVTLGSNKKVWWQCLKNKNHEWFTSVVKRTSGQGCPFCYERKPKKGESLAEVNQVLAQEFHPFKNGQLTAYDIFPTSHKKIWWKCPEGEDHEWEATIASRTYGNGCPICSKRKIVSSNCLANTNPLLASQWHPTKNKGLSPYEISEGGHQIVWWKCPEGPDHEWRAQVKSRSIGRGCPFCANQKVVPSNCLAQVFPQLAKEWHPIKNGDLTPFDLVGQSSKKIWWKCNKGKDHEWVASPNTRSKGIGCPYCTLTPQSRQELTITFELKQFFKINPKGFKTRVKGKLWTIDIYIKELKLGIEFDGSYWHKDKRQLDKIKTKKLVESGINIIRVREEPLRPITEIDVVSNKPFNPKKVTDDILKQLMNLFIFEDAIIKKMKDYLSMANIQNEKALDNYVDKVLREKANKSNVNIL